MKNVILEVLEQKDFDRYVFITYKDSKIIGLNFHQGIGEIFYNDFAAPCIHLTEIFNRLCYKYSQYNTLSIEEKINKSINLYIAAFIIQ
jgi:hypothetical protein